MERELAARYADLYHYHWWWRAREAILVRAIRRLGLPADAQILDVGCGDGLFFPELEAFGHVRGIEVDTSLLTADNPARARIFTAPLGDPAYDDWRFDLITALDVIEHIADDNGAVARMIDLLAPGGKLLITVPAFMSLWDRHDELNHHYRRYTAAELRRLLERHGSVARTRYLFPSLYVPKRAARWLGRLRGTAVTQDTIPPPAVSRLLAGWLSLEERITRPLHVPFGTSVLAVARAPEAAAERVPARRARSRASVAAPVETS